MNKGLCSACRQPIHRDQPHDTMGLYKQHRHRRDCLYALRERIRMYEAGIEQEAAWCEEISEMDLDPTESSDSNLKRAARLRALLK